MSEWEVRIITILIAAVAIFVYLVYKKWRYQQEAQGSVLCQIRNRAGRWRFERLPLEEGLLELRRKDRDGREIVRAFLVDADSAPDVPYPLGKWPIMQTTIPLAVFDEENFEPLSNVSGRPLASSRFLGTLKSEGWTGLAVRQSVVEMEKQAAEGPKKKKFGMSTMLWIILIVAAVAGLVFLWQYIQELQAAAGM